MIILRGFVLLILAILAGVFFWYVSDYYGSQKGDSPATISAEEQQKQTVEAIEVFLAQRKTI